MIFSNAGVSKFVRENFVAAWESVRPVPIVEIDFGNGTKLKRTLNGNIATYICAPDGRVVDIITGVMKPEAYLEQLRAALRLWEVARGDFDAVLAYHRSGGRSTGREIPDVAKAEIEAPMKRAIGSEDYAKKRIELRKTEEEELLEADTLLNAERKPLVHAMLAKKVVRPADVYKALYKDVLHCDLDDPYLGLASKAFNGGF